MNRKYQVMPPLSDKEYKSLKEDIKKDGVLVPIIYDENGDIIDGYHRIQICEELGIEDWPSITKTDLNETDKRSLARKLNSARRQLSQEQKRGLIKDQLKDTPEWSNRRIADMLGVHKNTVKKYRNELEEGGQIAHVDKREGADGKEYPPKKKSKTIINPTNESRKNTEELCKKSEDENVEQELDKISQGKETSSQAKKKIKKQEQIKERKKEISKQKEAIKNGKTDLPEGKFEVIVIDPPWSYGTKYDSNGRRVASPYPEMSQKQLKELDIPASEDSILFL